MFAADCQSLAEQMAGCAKHVDWYSLPPEASVAKAVVLSLSSMDVWRMESFQYSE